MFAFIPTAKPTDRCIGNKCRGGGRRKGPFTLVGTAVGSRRGGRRIRHRALASVSPLPDAGQRTGNAAYRLRIARSLQEVLQGYRLEYLEVARHPLGTLASEEEQRYAIRKGHIDFKT
jgi:hypothetical protein